MERPIGGGLRKGPPQDIERCEREIVNALLAMGVIDNAYVGSVTLHIHLGGISDLEKTEKSLKKKLNR